MNMSKITKISRTLNKVFLILQILTALCTVILFVGVCKSFINCSTASLFGVDFGSGTVHLGPLTLVLAEIQKTQLDLWIVAAIAIAELAAVGVVIYVFGIVRNILAPMAQGQPFHPSVGVEFRKLAFASLGLGVIGNILGMVDMWCTTHLYDLDALVRPEKVISITENYQDQLDLGFLVVFFAFLLISYVFQYGGELQKLSDETL